MPLADLALSRSRLDKVSDDRTAAGLLSGLLADPTTSLLPVLDGRAPVHEGPEGSPSLRTVAGDEALAVVAALGGAERLAAGGGDPAEEPVVVLLGRFPDDDPRAPGSMVALLLPPGSTTGWPDGPSGDLRGLGALLPDTDAGALTEAVALQHWHRDNPRCPRCGSATTVVAAGHERSCPVDGTTQHPRHDPAVIMTVTDPAGRLLLGHQGRWPDGRYSAFAGFVEPGESLEQAVARELLEEAGVTATTVEYLGSQPWPFPASLMVAFHAETEDTEAVPDGSEITEVRWFDRDGLRAAVAAGEITVPPAVSVARRLVERWLGGPLQQDGTWR
ncbi:NAD(+) diphosphatase [Aquipuribacter hungaricus]|uniref:NAD(+) diphosphatase n=1 Tax=Aquipuribacter hungaricus TaxID=545624 RepID=A0ABV7WPC0_9MICO